MNNWYKVEWETFDPLFDDGLSIGNAIHSEVTVYGWERACEVFMDNVKNDFCQACFVSKVNDEENESILSYCP